MTTGYESHCVRWTYSRASPPLCATGVVTCHLRHLHDHPSPPASSLGAWLTAAPMKTAIWSRTAVSGGICCILQTSNASSTGDRLRGLQPGSYSQRSCVRRQTQPRKTTSGQRLHNLHSPLCGISSKFTNQINLFTNVKFVFMSPNITSLIQPMGTGIIANFKKHYRSLVLRHFIDITELSDESHRVAEVGRRLTFLDALHMQKAAWVSSHHFYDRQFLQVYVLLTGVTATLTFFCTYFYNITHFI